tara:strand:+ start:52909 stop:53964 length:1056 start_codon:yes stop_codon:yes gene_type:complete
MLTENSEPPLRNRKRSRKGQLLVIFPFVILFFASMLLISVNIAELSTQRIRIQTATDACALSAARMQSMGFGIEAQLNYVVIGLIVAMVVHIVLLDGGGFVQRIKNIRDVNKYQEDVRDILVPLAMHSAVIQAALSNDIFGMCTYLPLVGGLLNSTTIAVDFWGLGDIFTTIMGMFDIFTENQMLMLSLGLSLTLIYPPGPWTKLGYDIMRMSDKMDQITTLNIPPFMMKMGVGFGDRLYPEIVTVLGAAGLTNLVSGNPRMIAMSSARPYFNLLGAGAGPREPEMDIVTFSTCMVILGPFWHEKLIETGMMGYLNPLEWRYMLTDTVMAIASGGGGIISKDGKKAKKGKK